MTRELQFVRYRSAVPNRRGAHPGVFALANGLAAGGRLTAADHEWWVARNAEAERLYPDPTRTTPGCYDPVVNPGAASWFRAGATHLLALTGDYLHLLDRYGVRWHELRSDHPGRIVHEDDVQVVAVPYLHPEDWPFA